MAASSMQARLPDYRLLVAALARRWRPPTMLAMIGGPAITVAILLTRGLREILSSMIDMLLVESQDLCAIKGVHPQPPIPR